MLLVDPFLPGSITIHSSHVYMSFKNKITTLHTLDNDDDRRTGRTSESSRSSPRVEENPIRYAFGTIGLTRPENNPLKGNLSSNNLPSLPTSNKRPALKKMRTEISLYNLIRTPSQQGKIIISLSECLYPNING